jgi:DNA-binding LytR/AlgR family response regulator
MNNLKKILIVEDELIIAENTKFLIQELYPKISVEVAGSSLEALVALQDFEPDLIFLDIRLGKNDNGIEFSKNLIDRNIPFIFLTAHGDDKTISHAIQMEPLGYMIKPVTRQDLNVNLKLVSTKIAINRFYIFKDGLHDIRLDEKEIVYLKVEGNYTEIHTINKRYVERKSMKKILDELHVELIQIHRSFYINPDFVKEANASVYMTTGEVLPLSRNYKKDLINKLF